MAGAKRMSAEEKKKTILGIYHDTKQVYTEKELVTLATKAGVNGNVIVDVNNELVNDGLVDKEKIGGSNYFWSFPAKKDRLTQIEYENNLKEVEKLQAAIQEATTQLADAKRGREDMDGERAKKIQRLAEIRQEKEKLSKEVESLKDNDPQALADLEKELKLVKEAAHRWTDNIFNCKSYLTKKRGMDKKEANRILGITGEFDYPEDKIPK